MTQAIAQDPVFLEMAKEMQEAMLSQGMGGMNLNGEDAGEATEGAAPRAAPAAAAGMPGMPGMPPMPGMPGIDPSKYMEVRARVGPVPVQWHSAVWAGALAASTQLDAACSKRQLGTHVPGSRQGLPCTGKP